MNTAETWKPISDMNNFEVSDRGRVRNVKLGLLKSTRKTKTGYEIVTLKQNGVKHTRYVHRLVAEAFIPNQNNLPCVNHKDENKSNNTIANLEWCSIAYNNTYRGRAKRVGEWHKQHHSTRKQVRCVETGEIFPSVREAARAKGVTMGISYCLTGKQKHAGGYSWEVV